VIVVNFLPDAVNTHVELTGTEAAGLHAYDVMGGREVRLEGRSMALDMAAYGATVVALLKEAPEFPPPPARPQAPAAPKQSPRIELLRPVVDFYVDYVFDSGPSFRMTWRVRPSVRRAKVEAFLAHMLRVPEMKGFCFTRQGRRIVAGR